MRAFSPRWTWFVLLTIVSIASFGGCGRDETVYDTAGNPDGYPAMAVELLNGIVSGQLQGGDPITEAFGQLYTEHPELLDNARWGGVIEKLGTLFARRADSLTQSGPGSLQRAGEYYQLASFARPGEQTLRHKAALFQPWLRATREADPLMKALTDSGVTDPVVLLAAARQVVFGDSLGPTFFRDFLSAPLGDRLTAAGSLDDRVIAGLSPADRALVYFCGLSTDPPEVRASLTDPAVDLAGCFLERIDSGQYRVEVYLIPHERLAGQFSVALQFDAPGSTGAMLELATPGTLIGWSQNEMAALSQTFRREGPIAAAAIGLLDGSVEPPRFMRLAEVKLAD